MLVLVYPSKALPDDRAYPDADPDKVERFETWTDLAKEAGAELITQGDALLAANGFDPDGLGVTDILTLDELAAKATDEAAAEVERLAEQAKADAALAAQAAADVQLVSAYDAVKAELAKIPTTGATAAQQKDAAILDALVALTSHAKAN